MTTSSPKAPSGKDALFTVIFLVLALVVNFALGEIITRIICQNKNIYNIEMVKYATQLKMPDPSGQASHVHRSNASAKLMGVEIALNSLGHRSRELSPTKSEHTKRVYVLGSSVTMGWGVPYDDMFTSAVEKKLNTEKPFGDVKFEFANAGIGNYNTFFQSKLFERQYPQVKPDLVVLHYFISDVEPRSKGRNSFILKHSFLAAFLFDKINILRATSGGKVDLVTHYSKLYEEGSEDWKKTQALIGGMRDRAKQDHVPFVIMIIPDFHNLAEGTPYAPMYAKMEEGFKKLGIPTINTFEEFQRRYGKNERELWIQDDDPHPNAKAHALMSELLYRYLVSNNPMQLGTAYARTESK